VALAADEVQIYTDVDGVMTADPRACAGAEVLETIRADELFQMARHGSRVMHTPAAELALAAGLNVRIRNTYSDHAGTKVADISAYRPSAVATAVSHTTGVVRIRASLGAAEGTREHMRRQSEIYRALADEGVSLDMFTPAGDCLLFTVDLAESARATAVLARLGIHFEPMGGLAQVTIIGAGMHGVPGVVSRMAAALAAADAHVYQTADSHTTISALIEDSDLTAALDALHAEFELGDKPCTGS
jgi:aspartate kinase